MKRETINGLWVKGYGLGGDPSVTACQWSNIKAIVSLY